MPEYELQSGAKLLLNPAPYEDAVDLRDAIFRALKDRMADLSSIQEGETDEQKGAAIAALIFDVASRPGFDAVVMRCAARGTYTAAGSGAPMRIGPSLFGDTNKHWEAARRDHMGITRCVIELNFMPFWSGIFSELKALAQTIARAPKSASV